MKKVLNATIILFAFLTSCSKGAFKKEEGSFKANGIEYAADEDMMNASYIDSKTLDVMIGGGPSMTYNASLRLDLTKLNTKVSIPKDAEGFIYYGSNSAVQYLVISGEYEITSHEAGNPAKQHTEGNFNYKAVNQYNPLDTITITEGYFYVNNY